MDNTKNQLPITKDYRKGKKKVHFSPKKGESLDLCATYSDKYICCNVHVLKSISNCPYDCSYCFLQNYLNNGTMSVVTDIKAMIDEIKEKTAAQPWRFFRIGNWELGDSLALEKETQHAEKLIHAFSSLPNALLELKTKSANVDSILNLDHKGRTVVSWSLNSEKIVNYQEHRTASLEERLNAIEKVTKAGYLTGFHFDPMIHYEKWEEEYTSLIQRLFKVVNINQIAWISIGSLRFNPEMKKKMEQNFPKQTLTTAEMIVGKDGKMRYPKPTRVNMYQTLFREINKNINTKNPNLNNSEKPLIYLCMEAKDVWERCIDYSANSIGELDYIFTNSLYIRYANLVHEKPIKDKYINLPTEKKEASPKKPY